jgi:hypothetical protein
MDLDNYGKSEPSRSWDQEGMFIDYWWNVMGSGRNIHRLLVEC